MSQEGTGANRERAEQALKMALVGVIGQVGCLTFLVIMAALLAGLWLDSQFHTRPLFALALVLGSVPVTLYVMFRVVLSATPRIQMTAKEAAGAGRRNEVPDRDRDSQP